jgi:hypothetical protein
LVTATARAATSGKNASIFEKKVSASWGFFTRKKSLMKPYRLTAKEIARAFEDGTTVVVRRIKGRGSMEGSRQVSVVDTESGLPVFQRRAVVEYDEGTGAEVASTVRMLDKCGMGGQGASASRHRVKKGLTFVFA